jgi:hypothetical protein
MSVPGSYNQYDGTASRKHEVGVAVVLVLPTGIKLELNPDVLS